MGYFRRLYSIIGIITCIFILAGCSALSGAGPYLQSIQSNDDETAGSYRLVDLSPATMSLYSRPKERELRANVSNMDIPDIRLIRGDVISVMVADSGASGTVFATLAEGGTRFTNVRVNSDGRISLPYIKYIYIAGSTLREVEEKLLVALRGIVSEPQVRVELTGDLSGSVLVAGAVKSPGRFSALQGPLTLLDAINMAGGPLMEPHLANVTVRNGKSVTSVSYQEILSGNNVPISPHSEVIVDRAKKRFVAMGAVNKPGLHDMPAEFPSLLEVLGEVGGLNERSADPRGVFVFRISPDGSSNSGRAEVIRLNMREPAAIFLARQFLILPEDAIYVTNAAVYEWQKIIAPIVQTLVFGQRLEAF